MFIIDRFEGQWAVIEGDEKQTFNLPRQILPAEAKQGDVVLINITVDQVATQERSVRIKKLMEGFFDQ